MTAQTLIMFPGQGSQFVGMGRDLLNEFPQAKLTFEEAEDTTRLNIRKLCLDGPEEKLKLTANQQPSTMTLSIAMWRVIQNETDFQPQYMAGHSLGEYAALVASQKLDFSSAVQLVKNRGQAMQKSVPPGIGSMAAIINYPADKLEALCKDTSKQLKKIVEVVNYNSPQQLIISGHKEAVETACSSLEGQDKVKTARLNVSAPFHSSLMAPAKDEMEPLITATEIKVTDIKVIANLTGQVEPSYGKDLLINQIDSPVLWTQTLKTAEEHGCNRFVEIGPGKVLFGLARRSVTKSSKLMHSADIKATIEALKNK